MLLIVLVVSLPMLTRLFPQQVSLPLWPGKCSVLLNWWLFVQVYSIIITLSLPLSSSEYSPRWDYLLISSSLHDSRRWYFYLAIINLPSFLPSLPHTHLHGENIQALPPPPHIFMGRVYSIFLSHWYRLNIRLALDNGMWMNETQFFLKTPFNTLNNLDSLKKFIALW